MEESKDLKPGGRCTYHIEGKDLIIEPIPYGQLKKLMRIVFSVLDKIQNMQAKEVMAKLPELFENNLGDLISLMFKKKTHEFLTPQWVDENVSLVDMQVIVEKVITVNGLQDFLVKMGLAKKEPVPPVTVLVEPTGTSGPDDLRAKTTSP